MNTRRTFLVAVGAAIAGCAGLNSDQYASADTLDGHGDGVYDTDRNASIGGTADDEREPPRPTGG